MNGHNRNNSNGSNNIENIKSKFNSTSSSSSSSSSISSSSNNNNSPNKKRLSRNGTEIGGTGFIADRVKFFQQKDTDRQPKSPILNSRHSRQRSDCSNESGSQSPKVQSRNNSKPPTPNSSQISIPTQQINKPIPPKIQRASTTINLTNNNKNTKRLSRGPLPTPPISRSTSIDSNLSDNIIHKQPTQQQQQQPIPTHLYNNQEFETEDNQQYNVHKDQEINEDYNQQQIALENLTMSNFDNEEFENTTLSSTINGSYVGGEISGLSTGNEGFGGFGGEISCSELNSSNGFDPFRISHFKKHPMDKDTETVLEAIDVLERYHSSPENHGDNGDLIDVSMLDGDSETTTDTDSCNTSTSISTRNSLENNNAASAHTKSTPITSSASTSSSSLLSMSSNYSGVSSNNGSIGDKQKKRVSNSQGTFLTKSTSSTTTNEELQKKVLEELLVTEEDYLRDLDFIINEMVEPLTAKGFDKPTLQGVFSNIEIIRNVSKTIVDDLKQNQLNLHNCVQVFKKMSAFFKMYSQYCTHHTKSIQICSELIKNNSTFAAFKNEISSNPNGRGLSLLDYLIKPIQRICKYPLLFNELLRSTSKDDIDYQTLVEVHSKLVEVAEFVNQCQHIKENNDRLLEIQNSVEGSPYTILESTRKILKECWVRIKEVNTKGSSDNDTHNRYIFLFNDTIMFTKNSSFTKKYQYSFSLPYHSTRLSPSVKPLSILLSGLNSDNISINIEIIFQDQAEKDEVSQLLVDLIDKGKKQLEKMKIRSSVLIPKNLSANNSPDLKSSHYNTISSGGSKSSTIGKSMGNTLTSPTFISKTQRLDNTKEQSNPALLSLSKIMMEQDAKKRRSTLNPVTDKKNIN